MMSTENLHEIVTKERSVSSETEADEKCGVEVEATTEDEVKNEVELIINQVVTMSEAENDSNKSVASNTGSNSSRRTESNRGSTATLNHEFDRRLNPDAPVFVPRSSTCSPGSSSLVQKNFNTGEEEKIATCGAVYDSIWHENAVAPIIPTVQTLLSGPKLPSTHMMVPSPMTRHFHHYGPTNSAATPGFRGYLTPQSFYEMRRTQSNLLGLQPLNMYASSNLPQPLNYSNLNVENKLSTLMPLKSMPNVAFVNSSPAGGGIVEGVDSIEGNNDTEASNVPELVESKETSPIKSKMRGVLVHKSRNNNNYDPCDIKYGRGCCCSLM